MSADHIPWAVAEAIARGKAEATDIEAARVALDEILTRVVDRWGERAMSAMVAGIELKVLNDYYNRLLKVRGG